MAVASEKVKMLKFKPEAQENVQQKGVNPEQIKGEVRRDMGKVGLLVALMAVALMVIFFFSIKQNVAGLDQKVSELYTLKSDVSALDSSVASMNKRLSALENLPEETRKMIYMNMLEELSQKAEYLSGKLKGDNQAQLMEARKLLRQAQQGLGK